jgi:hypothetical protein
VGGYLKEREEIWKERKKSKNDRRNIQKKGI